MIVKKIFFIFCFLFFVKLFLFADINCPEMQQLKDSSKVKISNFEKKDHYIKFTIKYSDLFNGENFGKK